VLLFHALLLHSSGVNLSDRVRLSLQPRFTALADVVDPAMGGVVPVGADVVAA
jgi:hypothetical protein